MFNWDIFWQIWLFILAAAVGITWLGITMLCAWGEFSKRFQVIWGIINAVLIIASTVIIGFIAK